MTPPRSNDNPKQGDGALLAAIVESSDDAIIGKMLDGTITSWNRGAEQIYGYTSAEMLGKSISLLSPRDHDDEVLEFLDRIRQGRHVDHYETVRVRKDGKRINVALTISPIKDQAGQIIGASSIARDITERKRIEEERLRLAAIVDSSDDAILGMALDGTVISWNRGAEKMLGFTGEEIIGRSIRLIYPPDRPDELPEIVAKMKRGERIDHYETERQRKDHTVIDVSLSVSPIRDSKGEVVGISKIARDISGQKRVAQYARSLIEASLDPLVTISTEGKITDVNEATIRVTGVSREQLIGADFSNYFTEPKKAREGYEQVFKRGYVTDYPLTIRSTSGKLTDVLYNASVYKDERGNVLGVFAAARDITTQKQASQYARSLIEASLDPLVTISAEGKITDVNEATIRVTDVPREQLIGADFSAYFTEPEKARQGYQEVFKKGFVTDYPLTIRSTVGKLTDVLYNASVYKDDKGNVLGVFAAARDYSRVKQTTQQLESTNTELEAFSYTISHDLRAPLRAIDGFAKILVEEHAKTLDGEGSRLLATIQTSAAKMGVMIDELLAFSRLGREELRKQNVDMQKLAKDVFEELEPSYQGREVRCRISALPPATGDSTLLRQVWRNLLSNAVKFTRLRPVAEIAVAGEMEDGKIVYAITDNGAGFDPAHANKLFGVFQRLHSGEFEGTGCGLAVVRRIVERHGGKIWAEGKIGEGAVFRFTLPATQSVSNPTNGSSR